MVIVGPLLKSVKTGMRVVFEYLQSVRRLKIKVLAGQSKDGMHEALVLGGNGNEEVLECVLVFTLDRQNGAQVGMIVFPENHVLRVLQPMKDGLHGDDWQAMGMTRTFFRSSLFTTSPDLFLWIALAYNSILLTVHTSGFGFIALLLAFPASEASRLGAALGHLVGGDNWS